jgi:hypothetical protein
MCAKKTATPANFSVLEASFADLQNAMTSGQISSKQLTQIYLERIEAYDRNGPKLHSVIETNPDALKIAEALDHERRSQGARGPLHGIPILVKDNIDTADRMHTSAGSLAMAKSIAPRDSTVAARLRAAGAVLLGKANMTEWANFMTVATRVGHWWLEFRLGHCHRRQPLRGCHWHRNLGFDSQPVKSKQLGGHQADCRSGFKGWGDSRLEHPGHSRTNDPQRARRSHFAVCDCRQRPA